ncbi:hypothetical protein [Thetidibacter halocola]|uniref:Uncharacterized protein n=1 Tax=Thetidibacter halocola TaxID=2827239 RepID=A0A8J7WFT1_9RHOB|nr:hypothetical protein [Thetidibacter halocola]MBS0124344.1 hypothetical protein [Thetidibacter halocola]
MSTIAPEVSMISAVVVTQGRIQRPEVDCGFQNATDLRPDLSHVGPGGLAIRRQRGKPVHVQRESAGKGNRAPVETGDRTELRLLHRQLHHDPPKRRVHHRLDGVGQPAQGAGRGVRTPRLRIGAGDEDLDELQVAPG